MIAAGETETLRVGLRALAALGRAAPLDLVEFAGLTGMTASAGEILLTVFESHGYARRVPGGSIFVLTRLGLDLLGDTNAAGRLVSEAIEPVAACSQQIGRPLTLGLPCGDELLCCVVAGDPAGLPRPGERLPMTTAVAGLSARGHCNDYALCTAGHRAQLAVAVPLADELAAVLSVHGVAADLPEALMEFLPVLRMLASRLAGRHRTGRSTKVHISALRSSRIH